MARKPWCRVLYWFAMLIDAERIDREVKRVSAVDHAELVAAGFHAPESLPRVRDEMVARLRQAAPQLTEDELIAYALQRQQEVKAAEMVS